MNGPALMTTENRNGGRVITFSSGIFNPTNLKDPRNYSKIADARRPTIFKAEAEKKSDEIGSVFEKPQSPDLKDSLTKTEVKGEVRGIDKDELAKAVLDSNVTKTAAHTNNSFGMMND